MDDLFRKESKVHTLALLVAIFGPLINLLLGFTLSAPPPGMYVYWVIVLSVYVAILIPFTYKSPLTLIKLIFLGIMIEDFSSALWKSLLLNKCFLPFPNWYTQHFPFLGSLGEPTPLILIPQWYFVAILVYLGITWFQHRKITKKT